MSCLTSEAVQGATLSLESVDNVKSCYCLATSVLSVGDSVTDDILKENLQDASSLLVDEARDTLHTTSSSETTDCGLSNALDVISKNFAVSLGTTLA